MAQGDGNPPLVILNGHTSRTGAGRYAKLLFNATRTYSKLYSLAWRRNPDEAFSPGVVVHPIGIDDCIPEGRSTATLALRRLAIPVTFRDFFHTLKEWKRNGTVIHYASQMLFPVDLVHSDPVSILDTIAISSGLASPLDRALLQRFLGYEHITTISAHVRDRIHTLRPEVNATVIRPAVDASFHPLLDKTDLRRTLRLDSSKTLVLVVTSGQKRKNLDTVIRVRRSLPPDYDIVSVGECGVGDRSFQNIDDQTLNLLYNACDVLLFIPLAEGFGYPIIEAFAAGLPVIASNIEVVREVAGEAAQYVNPTDQKEIVHTIRDIESFKDHCSKLGVQRAQTEFSIDRFRKEMISFHRSLGVRI
jgi:glycosyltransferase involved in cell wall biosynthesis